MIFSLHQILQINYEKKKKNLDGNDNLTVCTSMCKNSNGTKKHKIEHMALKS